MSNPDLTSADYYAMCRRLYAFTIENPHGKTPQEQEGMLFLIHLDQRHAARMSKIERRARFGEDDD